MKWNPQMGAILLALCAALLLCSCSSVSTKYPLTADPKAIDQEKFEGSWQSDKSVLRIQFAKSGIAQIAGLVWKDDNFEIARGEMIVTQGNEYNFLSVRFREDEEWMEGYLLVQYRFTDQGDLVLWRPNNDAFEEAILKTLLTGDIQKSTHSSQIRITSEPGTLLKFINDPDNLTLFEYREPMILRKIAEDNRTKPK